MMNIFPLLLILSIETSSILKSEVKSNNKSHVLVKYIKELNNNECGSGFFISHKLESNLYKNKEIAKYLYFCLIDKNKCEKIDSVIFNCKSFYKTVKYIYSTESFEYCSIYDDKSQWIQSYYYLLYYCKNKNSYYKLIKYLLKLNNDDALYCLWKDDYKSVESDLNKFVKRNIGLFDKLAKVAVVYHNHRDYSIRNKMIELIKETCNTTKLSKLNRLFEENAKIDYESFYEKIYGGV